MSIQEPREDDIRAWYYGEVAKLGLVGTDCPGIFRTDDGIVVCHYVQDPAGFTRDRAEEQIKIMRREMEKRKDAAPKRQAVSNFSSS